jgi:hypothetical protein
MFNPAEKKNKFQQMIVAIGSGRREKYTIIATSCLVCCSFGRLK